MLPKHVRYQAALHPARPGCRHRRWFCSRRRNISYYTCVHLSTPFFNFSEKTSLPFLLPSQRSLAPLCKGSCPAPSRTEGLPHGLGARGRAHKPSPNLRTEPALRAAPVFRSAYSASRNARPSGSLRSPSDAAPNLLFKLLRCFAWLIFLISPPSECRLNRFKGSP